MASDNIDGIDMNGDEITNQELLTALISTRKEIAALRKSRKRGIAYNVFLGCVIAATITLGALGFNAQQDQRDKDKEQDAANFIAGCERNNQQLPDRDE